MTAVDEFKAAQERLLQHYGVDAESQFIEVAAVEGRVHVLRSLSRCLFCAGRKMAASSKNP